MTRFYLSSLIVTYLIYLIIIPKILHCSKNEILKFSRFNLNKKSIILSLLFLLFSFIGFMIQKPLVLIENNSWLWGIQPPLVEELLFRGIIPVILLTKLKKFPAFVVSVLYFSAIHLSSGNIQQLFVSTVLGIIFMMITTQTDSIIPTIIFHYIVNSNSSVALLLCLGVFLLFEIIELIKLIFLKRTNYKYTKANT